MQKNKNNKKNEINISDLIDFLNRYKKDFEIDIKVLYVYKIGFIYITPENSDNYTIGVLFHYTGESQIVDHNDNYIFSYSTEELVNNLRTILDYQITEQIIKKRETNIAKLIDFLNLYKKEFAIDIKVRCIYKAAFISITPENSDNCIIKVHLHRTGKSQIVDHNDNCIFCTKTEELINNLRTVLDYQIAEQTIKKRKTMTTETTETTKTTFDIEKLLNFLQDYEEEFTIDMKEIGNIHFTPKGQKERTVVVDYYRTGTSKIRETNVDGNSFIFSHNTNELIDNLRTVLDYQVHIKKKIAEFSKSKEQSDLGAFSPGIF
jgi:DNA-binding protein